ncbi:MAG: hypothetical protein ACRDN9_04570 [Streptosporangiaceae bacterium]
MVVSLSARRRRAESGSSSAVTFVLDAGALIALERADPVMTSLLMAVRARRARVIVPDAVVAQVCRGGVGRQARVSALLGLRPEQCSKVSLDTTAARRIGVKIAECGHTDIVDVHVTLVAHDDEAAVVTSDRHDILAVDPGMKDLIVDI